MSDVGYMNTIKQLKFLFSGIRAFKDTSAVLKLGANLAAILSPASAVVVLRFFTHEKYSCKCRYHFIDKFAYKSNVHFRVYSANKSNYVILNGKNNNEGALPDRNCEYDNRYDSIFNCTLSNSILWKDKRLLAAMKSDDVH